jgi:hypothetical protein
LGANRPNPALLVGAPVENFAGLSNPDHNPHVTAVFETRISRGTSIWQILHIFLEG